MSEFDENEYECPPKPQVCPAIGKQTAVVCLPVTISPKAVPGPAKILCCGEAVVMPSCHCKGKVDGTCEFTISQKIRVELPVEFGATVSTGETYIDCECTESDEPEDDCGCPFFKEY